MPDWLLILLTTLVGAVVGLVVAAGSGAKRLVTAWFERREREMARSERDARRHSDNTGFTSHIEYRRVMAQLRAIPSVQRVLLFTGRNGGGLPEPGKSYVVSAEDGWSELPTKNPLEIYRNDLVVDDEYISMLQRLVRDKKVVNVTADMPETATLRAYYTEEGVVASVLYLLKLDMEDGRVDYLSIGSYTDKFTILDTVLIERCVYQLRALANR